MDEECLYSVIDRETKRLKEYAATQGYVNMIQAEWRYPDPEVMAEMLGTEVGEGDPYDEGEEPLEGCRLYDVGWARVNVGAMIVDAHPYLHGDLCTFFRGCDILYSLVIIANVGFRVAGDNNYVRPLGIIENF